MRRYYFMWLVTLAIVLAPLQFSRADEAKPAPRKAFGLRAGYGTGPDQFVIGIQSVFGKIFKVARFAPSLDFGFGSNLTTIMLNADVRLLNVSPPGSTGGVYASVGPTLGLLAYNSDGTDTEVGLSLVGGIRLPLGTAHAYNLEARVGIGDIPDFRILFGVFFGGGTAKPPAASYPVQQP